MKRNYDVKLKQTVELINFITNKHLCPVAVIMRHSNRYFASSAEDEFFMCLTPEGQDYAYKMGQSLSSSLKLRFYSSFIPRCIQTSYLLEKGFYNAHGNFSPHNQINETLTPFYINDHKIATSMLVEQGEQSYIRKWLDNKIDTSVMKDPKITADILTDYMVTLLSDININLHLISEILAGNLRNLKFEKINFFPSIFPDFANFNVAGQLHSLVIKFKNCLPFLVIITLVVQY